MSNVYVTIQTVVKRFERERDISATVGHSLKITKSMSLRRKMYCSLLDCDSCKMAP